MTDKRRLLNDSITKNNIIILILRQVNLFGGAERKRGRKGPMGSRIRVQQLIERGGVPPPLYAGGVISFLIHAAASD